MQIDHDHVGEGDRCNKCGQERRFHEPHHDDDLHGTVSGFYADPGQPFPRRDDRDPAGQFTIGKALGCVTLTPEPGSELERIAWDAFKATGRDPDAMLDPREGGTGELWMLM